MRWKGLGSELGGVPGTQRRTVGQARSEQGWLAPLRCEWSVNVSKGPVITPGIPIFTKRPHVSWCHAGVMLLWNEDEVLCQVGTKGWRGAGSCRRWEGVLDLPWFCPEWSCPSEKCSIFYSTVS